MVHLLLLTEPIRTRQEALKTKTLFLAIALVLGWLSLAMAQVWVDPYVRNDGTRVDGHYRSKPDGNPYNNWSYPGNTNPYTSRQGTGDPNRYLDNYNRITRVGSAGAITTPMIVTRTAPLPQVSTRSPGRQRCAQQRETTTVRRKSALSP
jgi:hypothetical protein